MNKLALILAFIFMTAFAQQSPVSEPTPIPGVPVHAEWICPSHGLGFDGSVNLPCYVGCTQNLPDGTTSELLPQYHGVPSSWTCPGDPNWSQLEVSRNCARMGPPVTCVPVSQSTSSNGGDSSGGGNNKVLIAGGVAIAAVLAVKFLAPDLPEGTSIRPTANVAYRDGFPSASVGLSGEYGPLSFSASSAHTGEKWTKPYAQVRWTWAF